VTGSYYLQTLAISGGAVVAATIVGLPAAAVLVVNNYRDLEPDRAVGKRTLAVCLGRRFTRWQYAALMLAPFALLAPLAAMTPLGVVGAVPMLALPSAAGLVRRFWREAPGPAFNALLAGTARFQVVLSVLVCAAALIA
jgi:1,4-dihydroxy-2-naphthoate octaprenyltransferase